MFTTELVKVKKKEVMLKISKLYQYMHKYVVFNKYNTNKVFFLLK